METPPGFKKFFAAFMARLHYAESNGGDYAAENKTSSAVGKYQFLWNTWKNEINKFAKNKGFGQVDKEGFKNNPGLQEAFFEKYAKDTVFPNVKKLAEKNDRNLDLDEIAQLYHMSPAATKKYMAGNKWEVPGKNSSLQKYLADGQKGLSEFGATPVRKGDTFSKDEKRKWLDMYFLRKGRIQMSDHHEAAKKQQLSQLNQEYNELGLVNDINALITQKVQNDENAFNGEKALFESVYDLLAYDPEVGYDQKGGNSINLKFSGGKPYVQGLFLDPKSKKVLEMLQEKHPEIKIRDYKEGSKVYKNLNFRLDESNPMAKYLAENIKKYNGLDVFEDPDGLRSLFMDEKHRVFGLPVAERSEDRLKDLSFDKQFEFPEDGKIQLAGLPSINKRYKNDKSEAVAQTDFPGATEQKPPETVAVANKETEEQNSLADLLAFEDELQLPDDPTYNAQDFPAQIPFDAVVGGLLGIMGVEGQDNDIPKRNEQISAGVQDYVQKLAQLSRMGLPPEVEAEAKNKIASGYQMGLQNIVEASGGNRNLVLGNQASLDLANILGQSNIAIEDFKAKNEALYQYGQGAMYINEFEANRDIANKQLEQEIAFARNDQSGALIEAGFSTMISALQQARENGPGSSRHMLSSMIRQNAFGYDPEMRDDGTGQVKGTRSWYEKNVVGRINQYNEDLSTLRSNYNNFDNDQKNFINLISSRTKDIGQLRRASDFAKTNTVSNPNTDYLGEAVEKEDYQGLFSKFNPVPETSAENASNFTNLINAV